jgi:hypothetical protein
MHTSPKAEESFIASLLSNDQNSYFTRPSKSSASTSRSRYNKDYVETLYPRDAVLLESELNVYRRRSVKDLEPRLGFASIPARAGVYLAYKTALFSNLSNPMNSLMSAL